jgi:CheY-like chemotaxis protein
MKKPRILYIEDMKECYELTKNLFGNNTRVCWIKKITPLFERIKKNLNDYNKAVVDVNLDYSKPETEEGINIIRELRETSPNLEIICISSENKEEKALKAGANKFVYKKQFWGGPKNGR